MKPLSELSLAAARSVRVVLTDIDDTLTTEGLLTAKAYAALEQLHQAGFIVIPVTGRPAGWCDHIARMWPVDAVVGENGAFFFRYDRERKTMQQRFWASPEELAHFFVFLCSDKATYSVGSTYFVDGGMLKTE